MTKESSCFFTVVVAVPQLIIVATRLTLNAEMHLEGQPSGVKLEYRVKAENNVAPSEPSNSVFAAL